MSGTSATTGRYAVRAYGKAKDTSSQAFDDLMGKAGPVKTTPAHTKWGNTKIVAMREGEKKDVSEIIVTPKKARVDLEDPFSFDEEKRIPEKSAAISRTSSGTKLPGARIPVRKGLADWTKRSADKDLLEDGEEEEVLEVKKTPRREEEPGHYEYSHGLARSTRTYARAPFQNMVSSATASTSSGQPSAGGSEEPSRPPVLIRQVPPVEARAPSSNSPQMPDLHIQESEAKEDMDSEDDFFPPSFVKKPIKTYGGRCKAGPSSGSGSAVASTSSAPAAAAAAPPPPPVTRQVAPAPSTSTCLPTPTAQSAPSTSSTPPAIALAPVRVVTSPSSMASSSPSPTQLQQPVLARISPASSSSPPSTSPQRLVSPQMSPRTHIRKRITRYSDPKLLQEFKQRYESQHKEPDKLGKFTNSTVISHQEKKSGKGTTLIVLCKPKTSGEHEKKNDVVSKYFVSSTQNYRPKRQAGGTKRHYSRPVAENSDSDASNSNLEFGDGEGQFEGEKENVTSEHSQPSTSVEAEDLIVESDPAAEQNEADIFEGVFSNDAEDVEPVSKKPKKDQNSDAEIASLINRKKQQQQQQSLPEPAKGMQKIFLTKNEKKDVPPAQPPREIIVVPSAPSLRPMGATGGGRQRWGIPKAKAPEKVAPPAKRYRIFKSRVKQTDKDIEEEAKQEGSDSSNPASSSDYQMSSSQDILMPSSSQELESQNGETMMPVVAAAMAVDSPADSDSVGDVSEDSQELTPETTQLRPTATSTTSGPRRFFKSKATTQAATEDPVAQGSPKKLAAKAKYNARSWAMEEKEESEPPTLIKEAPKSCLRDPVTEREMPKITRSVHWAHKDGEESYTSLRVSKEHKQLFTVVRNVKEAHECQESGETQEFTDDLDYLMAGLKSSEPISIRCLSCIQLAHKCLQPSFRMHLRAHGIVSKIFHLLQDCRSDPSLALCTAAIMFMLSQDRLNMDLEQDSLTLMLQLLEVNNDLEADKDYPPAILKELERTTERVKHMCDPTKIDLDTISTGLLAMEALLSLTSRRAGEWFKEELRTHHGLDHIVELINQCSSKIQDDLVNNIDSYLSHIRRLDRCLRVLENISYVNADNVSCLISYKDGLLVTLTCRMLRLFAECVPAHPLTQDAAENKEVKESAAYNLFTCFLALLRVMLNLSHDNDMCSKKMGQIDGVINCIMMCVVNVVHFAPTAQRFDILVLSLGLLINLVEHCPANRQQLLESTVIIQDVGQEPQSSSALEVLIDLFCQREEAARQMESEADTETPAVEDAANKSGEWKETEAGVQWVIASAKKVREAEQAEKKEEAKTSKEEDEEETFMKALHKAGKHMEDSIVAAYVALVLGCLIQQNEDYISLVKCHLPNEDFTPMVYFLQKFLSFMSMTTALGSTGAERISSVIESLKKCAGIQSDP